MNKIVSKEIIYKKFSERICEQNIKFNSHFYNFNECLSERSVSDIILEKLSILNFKGSLLKIAAFSFKIKFLILVNRSERHK